MTTLLPPSPPVARGRSTTTRSTAANDTEVPRTDVSRADISDTASNTAGSDTAGSDTAGSDTAGSDSAGSDSAVSDTDRTGPSPDPAPVLRRRRVRWGTVGVGLVIVALVVGLVVTTAQARQRDAVASARVSALAAAQTYAVDLASYDYRHLDQDFGKVRANASPTFAKSFIQSSDALKSVLTKYKATARATVVAAGLTSGTTDRAVALVFLDQTVSNTAQKNGKTTDQSRVSITLARSHGNWVIDQVRLL